jgi:hypothetical protein
MAIAPEISDGDPNDTEDDIRDGPLFQSTLPFLDIQTHYGL